MSVQEKSTKMLASALNQSWAKIAVPTLHQFLQQEKGCDVTVEELLEVLQLDAVGPALHFAESKPESASRKSSDGRKICLYVKNAKKGGDAATRCTTSRTKSMESGLCNAHFKAKQGMAQYRALCEYYGTDDLTEVPEPLPASKYVELAENSSKSANQSAAKKSLSSSARPKKKSVNTRLTTANAAIGGGVFDQEAFQDGEEFGNNPFPSATPRFNQPGEVRSAANPLPALPSMPRMRPGLRSGGPVQPMHHESRSPAPIPTSAHEVSGMGQDNELDLEDDNSPELDLDDDVDVAGHPGFGDGDEEDFSFQEDA